MKKKSEIVESTLEDLQAALRAAKSSEEKSDLAEKMISLLKILQDDVSSVRGASKGSQAVRESS